MALRRSYMTYVYAIVLVLLLFLSSCNKNDGPTSTGNGNDDDNGGGTYKYIALNITCYFGPDDPNRPHVADVMVFDQASGQRLELGNSNSNGYYCTSRKLDCSKMYRIEIYQLPDQYCVIGVWDITCANNPTLFVDSYGAATAASFHLGSCTSPQSESGCWGE